MTCGYHIPLYDAKKIMADNFHQEEYQWIFGNEFTTCSQTCGIGNYLFIFEKLSIIIFIFRSTEIKNLLSKCGN